MEEAAQTLRADRWRTFVDISLPLMRPGLANAFLITLHRVDRRLRQPDRARRQLRRAVDRGLLFRRRRAARPGTRGDARHPAAAVRARRVLRCSAACSGARSTRRLSGKGDAGLPTPLPDGVRRLCYAVALPWVALTIVIYAMAFAGGFVETWGRDYTPTLRHYVKAFGIEWGPHGMLWAGAALELVLDDGEALGDRRAAHRRTRDCSPPTCSRGSDSPASRVRIRHDAVVRDSRHGDRRLVHPRVQRAADRDHRHRADPRRLQRVPQHAGRRARRHRVDGADRPQPRRGVGDARRARLHRRCARSCCRC